MRKSKTRYVPFIVIGLLISSSLFAFWRTPAGNAQCGSQASSCKNCHEVQGKMPVNKDGTGWHESHAFGDFCYICHAGNSQSMDENEAHTGMVDPLSDVQASCQQCHATDLMDRAQVYANTLGAEIGAGSAVPVVISAEQPSDSEPAEEAPVAAPVSAPTASAPSAALVASSIDLTDPNVVDYVQRYDEIVLGHRPVNKGNIILIILIGFVALGGGGFVVYNEGWLTVPDEMSLPDTESYPSEVIALLPEIEKLEKKGREALKQLLENPNDANELFDIIVRQRKVGGSYEKDD